MTKCRSNKVKSRGLAGDIPIYCAHDEIIPLDKITPNPRNPNLHPPKQIQLLAKIIQNQGWRAPITISKRSGFIVRGHGRLEAAKYIEANAAPVEYQEYESEEAEKADLIADNQIAELSNLDDDLLTSLLEELQGEGYDLDLTGLDEFDIENLLNVPEINIDDFFEEKEEIAEKQEDKQQIINCPHCGEEIRLDK